MGCVTNIEFVDVNFKSSLCVLFCFVFGRCHDCGTYGHISRNCPRKPCHACHKLGHMSNDCPERMKRRQIECFNCGEQGHGKRDCPRGKRSHSVTSGQGDIAGRNDSDTSVLSNQRETANQSIIHHQPVDLCVADKSQPSTIQPMVLSDFFVGQSCGDSFADLQPSDTHLEMTSSQTIQWDRGNTDNPQTLQLETKTVQQDYQIALSCQPVDLSRPPPFGLIMPQRPPQAFTPNMGYNDHQVSNSSPLVHSDQQVCPSVGEGMPTYVQNQLRQHCSTSSLADTAYGYREVQQVFPRVHSLSPSSTLMRPDANALMASQMPHVPLSASSVNPMSEPSYKTFPCDSGPWQQSVYGPTPAVTMQPQHQLLSTTPTISMLQTVPPTVLRDVDFTKPPPSFSSMDIRPSCPEPRGITATSSELQTGVDAVMWKAGLPAGFSPYGRADLAFHEGQCHLPMPAANTGISNTGDYPLELELAMRKMRMDGNLGDDVHPANFMPTAKMHDDLISRQNMTSATASVQNMGRKLRSRDPHGLEELLQFSNEILSASDNCYQDRMFEGQGCIHPFNLESLVNSSDLNEVLIPLQRFSCESTLVAESDPLYHIPKGLNQTSVVSCQQFDINRMQSLAAGVGLGFDDQMQECNAAIALNLPSSADVETSRSTTSLAKDEGTDNCMIQATGETPATSNIRVPSAGSSASDGQMCCVYSPPSDGKMYVPPTPERDVVTYSFSADLSEVPCEQQSSGVRLSNASVSVIPDEKTGDAVSTEVQNISTAAGGSPAHKQKTETGEDGSNSMPSNEKENISKTIAADAIEASAKNFQNCAADLQLRGYRLTKGMVLFSNPFGFQFLNSGVAQINMLT
jgi:hypothetical protein